jgi:hypothetical protein
MSGIRPFRIRPGHIMLNADGGETSLVGLELSISVAAEAANVIAATVSIVDAAGNEVSEQFAAKLSLVDGNADATNPGSAFEMDVTTGTGITAGTQDSMLITSTAAGSIVIDITDVAGASGATVYLIAEPININAAPAYSAVTFD